MAAFWIVPIAAVVWALITLQRVRASQDTLHRRLDAIERLMPRAPSA
jgi:hypothetical protein